MYKNSSSKSNKICIEGKTCFYAEIADTLGERERGLSGKQSLGDDKGMLFIFEEETLPGFWMKDMKFPIDILWIDENKKIVGIEKNMQAGDFRLSKNMNAEEIAQNLTHGTADVWVTIIEGLRKEEIAQILTENFKIPTIPFIEQAREGYLFPDTYLIPKDATIEKIISIFTANFEKKYTPELQAKVKSLGMTVREGLILASLVEKEAKFPEDKNKVAGIIYKRFKDDWMIQIDATIQYALRYQKKEKTWWKKDLTVDDINVDSTYNTYKYKGLPPAPICNPGLESLQAVANADVNTKYWYYISDKKGNMHYAMTLDEHNENIRKYLQ